jgi:hypothetical protein
MVVPIVATAAAAITAAAKLASLAAKNKTIKRYWDDIPKYIRDAGKGYSSKQKQSIPATRGQEVYRATRARGAVAGAGATAGAGALLDVATSLTKKGEEPSLEAIQKRVKAELKKKGIPYPRAKPTELRAKDAKELAEKNARNKGSKFSAAGSRQPKPKPKPRKKPS